MNRTAKNSTSSFAFEIHPTVFWASASLAVLFVVFSLLNLSRMTSIFDEILIIFFSGTSKNILPKNIIFSFMKS